MLMAREAMARGRGKLVALAVSALVALAVMVCAPHQAQALQPTASDNLSVGLISNSELVPTSSGYLRVYYDGDKTLGIENYDNNFTITSKKSLKLELPWWGGFYAASDGCYYLVEGQPNEAENDAAVVVRVIKYDKNWNRKGAADITGNASLFGGQVRYPFDVGCVEMVDYKGMLYIVTGHEGYVDPTYKQGHQGFLMMAVNMGTMRGSVVSADLWHSFAQYIGLKGSDLYVLQQSEGSRCVTLAKFDPANIESYPSGVDIFSYGGSRTSAWAIPCFATVDGMAVSASNVLGLGASIDQAKYDDVYDGKVPATYNVCLTVTPQSNITQTATQVKWLTSYRGVGKRFSGAKITKVNDNRFMVSWQEYGEKRTTTADDLLSGNVLHYLFVDGAGNKLSKEFTAAASISDCQPVVKGSKVVFCASNAGMVNFYSIDASTGAFAKKVYRLIGENATWSFSKGVLTVSGTGKIGADAKGSWSSIGDKVTKIVVGKGITEIGDGVFSGFDNLKAVEVKSGVKILGNEVFAFCPSLEKVYLPSSVKKIGKDLTWTGYYWVGSGTHVTAGTIYAPSGSYALSYAKKNGMGYKADATADGLAIKAKNVTKSCSKKAQSFSLGAKATIGGSKLTYKSNNKAIKVSSKGKVTVRAKYIGKATITITAKSPSGLKTTKKVSVTVNPTKTALTSVKNVRGKKAAVKWKKNAVASGYVVRYSTDKKFKKGVVTKKVAKGSKTSLTLSKLKKGKTYYVQVKTYKKVGGKTYSSAWSAAKKVKIRK